MAELQEILRIWLYEKHEFDDSLPRVYEEVLHEPFHKPASDDNLLHAEDWEILREVCGGDEEFFQLQTGLLDIEREFRGMSRWAGIYETLEDCLRAKQYAGEEEAFAIRQEEERRRAEAMSEHPQPGAVHRSLFDAAFETCESDDT